MWKEKDYTLDMILNSSNDGRLSAIDDALEMVRVMAGKLLPMPLPKTAMGMSGLGQIQRAVHKLLEAKVEFALIRERIEGAERNE